MPKPRSILLRIKVDCALKSHVCKASKSHLIKRGMSRLKVRNGRSWEHYCLPCARRMLEQGTINIQAVMSSLEFEEAGSAQMSLI